MGIFRRRNQQSQAAPAGGETKQPNDSTRPDRFSSNGATPASTKSATSSRKPSTNASPLVERDKELAKLRHYWEAATQGRGRVILLSAEAGFGKSALANTFLAEVAQSNQPHKIARAACSAQSGRDEPFWPFADAMGQIVTNKAKKTGEDVIDAFLELAPTWAAVIPVAGTVVGASIKTAQVVRTRTRVSDMPSPDKLMREYVSALTKEAAKQPILIFVDDLHWSDSASARLLSHLSRNVSNMRVLVLVAYRPSDIAIEGHPLRDLVSEMLRYDSDAEILLPPLSRDGLRALMNRLYPANKFPDTLVAALHENTGGSPMFVIETLRLMQSRGELVKDKIDGRWTTERDLADDELPRNVEAVIHKRLERLPADLLDALSLAAVQGTTFETAVLAHVMDRAELEVMKLIEPAEKIHDVIDYLGDLELDNDITARYRFTSNLFQRELLENLRGKQKMIAHRKTAEGLERLWDEDAVNFAPQLALHYEVGKVWDKAAYYMLASAKQARMAGAVAQAIGLYENAERLLNRSSQIDLSRQFEVDEGLSFLYELDSSYDQAEARAQRALRIGRDKLGWRRYAMLNIRLAVLAENAGQFQRAEALLNEVYDRIKDPADVEADAMSVEAFEVRSHLARILTRVSRSDEAVTFAEQALALLDQAPQGGAQAGNTSLGLQPARLQLMNSLALACAASGNYIRALVIYEEILVSARELNLLDMLARLLPSVANLYLMLGDYDQAKERAREMIDMATEMSSESLMAMAHLIAGRSLIYQSKPYAALRQLDQAAQVASKLKFFAAKAELLALRALALIRLGRVDDAQEPLDQSAILAESSGSREWVAYSFVIHAELLLAKGNAEKAVSMAQNATQIFHEEGARFEEAVSLRTLGHACRALGQAEQSASAYEHARELFAAMGNDEQADRTEREAGQGEG